MTALGGGKCHFFHFPKNGRRDPDNGLSLPENTKKEETKLGQWEIVAELLPFIIYLVRQPISFILRLSHDCFRTEKKASNEKRWSRSRLSPKWLMPVDWEILRNGMLAKHVSFSLSMNLVSKVPGFTVCSVPPIVFNWVTFSFHEFPLVTVTTFFPKVSRPRNMTCLSSIRQWWKDFDLCLPL